MDNLYLVVPHLLCAIHCMSSQDGMETDFGKDTLPPNSLFLKNKAHHLSLF